MLGHGGAHADQIVGDDTETDRGVSSAPVAAATEPVSTFDHADAPLAPGAPFLPVAEAALLLLSGLRAGWSDCLQPLNLPSPFGRGLVLVRARIRGDEARRTSDTASCVSMAAMSRSYQGTLIVDLVVDHDLVFRFLQLEQLSKLVGLAGLSCE